MPIQSCNECYRCLFHYHVRKNRVGCNKPDQGLMRPITGPTAPASRSYLYPTCFDPEYKPRLCNNFEEFPDMPADEEVTA